MMKTESVIFAAAAGVGALALCVMSAGIMATAAAVAAVVVAIAAAVFLWRV